jgi:hypothetical protein
VSPASRLFRFSSSMGKKATMTDRTATASTAASDGEPKIKTTGGHGSSGAGWRPSQRHALRNAGITPQVSAIKESFTFLEF